MQDLVNQGIHILNTWIFSGLQTYRVTPAMPENIISRIQKVIDGFKRFADYVICCI